jgi:hypothetical protein
MFINLMGQFEVIQSGQALALEVSDRIDQAARYHNRAFGWCFTSNPKLRMKAH